MSLRTLQTETGRTSRANGRTSKRFDGIFDGYDRCPSRPGPAMYDGCPAPLEDAPPRVTSIRAGGRAGRVTVHVALSRPAAVTVIAQRQICGAGRCAWKIARHATIPAAGTVTLRLSAGRYRLRLTAAGGPVRTKLLTVRR